MQAFLVRKVEERDLLYVNVMQATAMLFEDAGFRPESLRTFQRSATIYEISHICRIMVSNWTNLSSSGLLPLVHGFTQTIFSQHIPRSHWT